MSGATATAERAPDGLGLRPIETRAPNTGRSIENALAEMRRRAEAAVLPTARQAVAMTAPGAAAAAPAPLPPPDAVMPGVVAQAAHALPGPAPMAVPASQAAGGGTGSESLVVQIEVDGQLVPVTVGELQRGYLREQDYRRKTQVMQQEQRRAQEAQTRYQVLAQQLEQRLPALVGQHAAEFAQPIDWEKLSREDPIGATQKMGRLLAWQQAQAEQQALEQQRQRDQQEHKERLHSLGMDVLARLIPGWADPATRQGIQQALAQHAVSMGWTPQEVARAEVLDPRDVFMCWKSWNYDRLMAQRIMPQPVGVPTYAGNGTYRQAGAEPQIDELEQRFAQTRRLDDALAIARVRREQNVRPAAPPQPMSRFR